jgi:hypothetical protein
MNLKEIKDYENLYSFDLNTNKVYSHYSSLYLKPYLNKNGYYRIQLNKKGYQKNIFLHRLVYEAHNGPIPDELYIDHIDNNSQNNNIDNLRLATLCENAQNKKKPNNNTSGYKNINLTKNNTYRVIISKNNKIVYRKTFKALEEAIINRDIQLKLFHKEFYNLD